MARPRLPAASEQRFRAIWALAYNFGQMGIGPQIGIGPLPEHLSPLKWEHISLTGDYRWPHGRQRRNGAFRPLQPVPPRAFGGA